MGLIYGLGHNVARAQDPSLFSLNPGEHFEIVEPDMGEWFASLKRTDIVDAKSQGLVVEAAAESCCDAGDGYPIRILQEPWPPHIGTEYNGVAEVTDRSAKTLVIKNHDGTYRKKYRPEWTGDPVFKFPGNKLTRELEGNPTKTAWVFAGLGATDGSNQGTLQTIYCIVPLPPSA